jgi:hypothetical protein
MRSLQKHWRASAVIGMAVVFVLGIPSLQNRSIHARYWAVAFIAEVLLILFLRPLARE